MSAVHGTGITDKKKDTVRISVGNTLAWTVFVLGERVAEFIIFHDEFCRGGKCLSEDRIVSIILSVNKREVVRCNTERKLIDGFLELTAFFRVKCDPQDLRAAWVCGP